MIRRAVRNFKSSGAKIKQDPSLFGDIDFKDQMHAKGEISNFLYCKINSRRLDQFRCAARLGEF